MKHSPSCPLHFGGSTFVSVGLGEVGDGLAVVSVGLDVSVGLAVVAVGLADVSVGRAVVRVGLGDVGRIQVGLPVTGAGLIVVVFVGWAGQTGPIDVTFRVAAAAEAGAWDSATGTCVPLSDADCSSDAVDESSLAESLADESSLDPEPPPPPPEPPPLPASAGSAAAALSSDRPKLNPPNPVAANATVATARIARIEAADPPTTSTAMRNEAPRCATPRKAPAH